MFPVCGRGRFTEDVRSTPPSLDDEIDQEGEAMDGEGRYDCYILTTKKPNNKTSEWKGEPESNYGYSKPAKKPRKLG